MSTVLTKAFRSYEGPDASDSDSINKLSPTEVIVLDIPPLGAPTAKEKGSFWRRPEHELDSVATQPSVFDDPVTLEIYRPPSVWENAHRFDPLARWTWREEYVSIRLSN